MVADAGVHTRRVQEALGVGFVELYVGSSKKPLELRGTGLLAGRVAGLARLGLTGGAAVSESVCMQWRPRDGHRSGFSSVGRR